MRGWFAFGEFDRLAGISQGIGAILRAARRWLARRPTFGMGLPIKRQNAAGYGSSLDRKMTVPLPPPPSPARESAEMPKSPSTSRMPLNPLLHVLMATLVASVRSDAADLTARQLAVFLKVYLEPDTEQTVRGLAAALNVSKPAITRALDRLGEFDYIKRETDPNDRRSVIARRTPAGSAYLRTLSGYLTEAGKQANK